MKISIDTRHAHTLLTAALRRTPQYFVTLLLLTASLLTWHHFGMERTVEVSARTIRNYAAESDGSRDHPTHARLERIGDDLKLLCDLGVGSEWPYCKVRFQVGTPEQGLDLSKFSSVTIDAYFDDALPTRGRLGLINFDEGFSRPGIEHWVTHKINEAQPFEMRAGSPITLPLDVFHPSLWWIDNAKPPIDFSGRRIDHVMYVDLQSPPEMGSGQHTMTIRSIRFHGKLLTQSQLLAMLMTMWIASAIGFPILLSLLLRQELQSTRAENRLLAEINDALKLETAHLAGQAFHDPLTGVLNREGLRAELMSTSTLLTDPVSIVFIDIDHFKRINDEHSHAVGDLVLQHFAKTICEHVRAADRVVRWGGEEFLLVCPMSDARQAAVLAEKLRIAITHTSWPESLAVTASFGVAQHNVDEEIGNVIGRADNELYKAKRGGRNRVCADTPS